MDEIILNRAKQIYQEYLDCLDRGEHPLHPDVYECLNALVLMIEQLNKGD